MGQIWGTLPNEACTPDSLAWLPATPLTELIQKGGVDRAHRTQQILKSSAGKGLCEVILVKPRWTFHFFSGTTSNPFHFISLSLLLGFFLFVIKKLYVPLPPFNSCRLIFICPSGTFQLGSSLHHNPFHSSSIFQQVAMRYCYLVA